MTFSAIAAMVTATTLSGKLGQFFSISTPKVDGAKSTVDITWDKEQ